jgi:FimV-like protein
MSEMTTQCRLVHEPKETLWSIASRYKNKWSIDIYSAMLAIYKSNLNKFTNQHIGQLNNHVALNCPNPKVIDMMGEKADMKAEFTRLNK